MDLIKIIPIETSKNYLYSTFYYGGFSKIISPLANGVNVLHLKPDSFMSLQMLIPSKETSPSIVPPSACFHLRALAANVALLRIAGFGEFFPLAIHSEVTLPLQYLVNNPL